MCGTAVIAPSQLYRLVNVQFVHDVADEVGAECAQICGVREVGFANTTGEREFETPPGAVVLTGSGGVIESPTHGPMMAWSLLFSNPPQGGVLELSNWDWDDVEGEESGGGTRWGEPYDFVGVWDGSEFTLTPELREALAPIAAKVQVDLHFLPIED